MEIVSVDSWMLLMDKAVYWVTSSLEFIAPFLTWATSVLVLGLPGLNELSIEFCNFFFYFCSIDYVLFNCGTMLWRMDKVVHV